MSDDVTRTTYVMVPTELLSMVAEGSLSKDAAWLYVALLSHHNRRRRDDEVWPSRTVLAAEIGLKKPQSVDRYLGELREAHLITSRPRKRSGNMSTSSAHKLLLVVPRTYEEITSAAIPHSGQRYPLQRTAAVPHEGQELDEVELEEVKDVEEISRTSGRSAPGGARHGNSEDRNLNDPWGDPWAKAPVNGGPRSHETATYENWHDRDRQTFREHVGDVLVSTGKNWKKGRYTTEAFYRAYRLKEQGGKRWPGQYVETLSCAGEEAVDDWLIDQGLMRPEWQ